MQRRKPVNSILTYRSLSMKSYNFYVESIAIIQHILDDK